MPFNFFFYFSFVFETRFHVAEAGLELLILRYGDQSGLVTYDCDLSTPEIEAGGYQRTSLG